MLWELMVMGGPLFGGDTTYNAVCALIVFLVGMGILFKTESKIGWLFIIAALGWAFLTFKDLIFM